MHAWSLGREPKLNHKRWQCEMVGVLLAGLALADVAAARAVKLWTYREMNSLSDLVVIATPKASQRTSNLVQLSKYEHKVDDKGNLTDILYREVVTTFHIEACVRGVADSAAVLRLRHYAYDEEPKIHVNSPDFATFDVRERSSYLLVLVKADIMFVPVTGQMDAAKGIRKLTH